MYAKLESIEQQYEDLEQQLSSPEIFQDQERYRKYAKAHSGLKEIVDAFREHKKVQENLVNSQEMLRDSDPDIREMAQEEVHELKERLLVLEQRLKVLLIPKDPLDEKNIILEIRAGTGGEEAALFAADLLRMYMRFAERKGFRVELMSESESSSGQGYKEVIANISGDGVYSHLKYESGTHRVQRVPTTESQGRIHTSAVTVAILPEAEEVDVEIKPEELRIDVFRSSGPGGQSVNTTDSAVRITHEPTGLVVICQDEKSQHKNKAKALKVLRSRLLQIEQERQQQEEAATRKSQVGSGDRSERIRTYNFPQSRITDHRINLTVHNLEEALQGALDDIIDALVTHYQTESLKQQSQVT